MLRTGKGTLKKVTFSDSEDENVRKAWKMLQNMIIDWGMIYNL
jgi:hypothetical protein